MRKRRKNGTTPTAEQPLARQRRAFTYNYAGYRNEHDDKLSYTHTVLPAAVKCIGCRLSADWIWAISLAACPTF